MKSSKPKPPKKIPRVGDVVHVEGCHNGWRPLVEKLHDDGTATIRTNYTGTRKRLPLADLTLASEIHVAKRDKRGK